MNGNKNDDENIKAKNRRIKSEVKKLTAVMTDVQEDTTRAADGLIKRAAFMRVSLEDYEEDLNLYGHTEMFSQSEKTDPYERERPTARLYNAMIKNYNLVMTRLFDLIPAKPASDQQTDPAYEKFFGSKAGKT